MRLPNLNKTKVEVKKLIVKGSIVLMILILVSILSKILTPIKNSMFPDPSLLPQTSFGKLSISFPNNSENINLTYSVDTITGLLPNFQKIMKVYKIVPVKPDLLAFKRTEDRVKNVGFTKEGNLVSQDSYQWVEQDPPQTITINIFSSDFTFLTPYLTSQKIQTFSNSDQIQMAIDKSQLFLENMHLFPEDLDIKKTKTTNYSIVNNTLSPSTSISNTNIVGVDFFQKDIESLPIYYENSSSINFLVGIEQNQPRVMEARYFYKKISDDSSTYPIKTASDAFTSLKQRKAYIVQSSQNVKNIFIKNVSLGYFMQEKRKDFLVPIVIFEGDNFIAYVLAIKDEWVNN